MSNARFQVVIAAVDKASSVFGHIMHGLQGVGHAAEHAGAASEHAGNRWQALGLRLHLLHGQFGELNAGIGETRESLTQFLPALEVLGAGASVAGLFEITNKVAEQRSELQKTATIIGISTEKLEGLNLAAKLTDVPLETMQSGLTKLNRGIALAAIGQNKDLAGLFHHIGLNARDANGHLRDAASVLPDFAEAIRKTHDPAMRTRMAMAAFGKSGADMLPLLMQDKEGLEKFQEQAEKIVAPVSEDQQKSLEKFHGSWIMLTEAAEGFETAIGAKLAPVLQPIIDSVREWMTANREWLTTEISKNVKQLSDWLSNIPWKDTVKGITDFAHSALDLADHLGGARIAVGALGLVMGAEMLPKIKQTIGLAETIGEIMVGPFAEAFMEGGKALWAGEGAMEAFNTALLENPIALIVSAVILLGLAAYEIYEHWDGVKDFFSKLWEKVVGLFQSNAFYLRTIVELIGGIPLLLFMAWRAVTPFFTALWDVVKGVFKSAWDYIGPIVDKIGKSVSVITNGISGVAGKVGSSISSVGHGIAHTAGSIADSVAGEMDHAYGYAPAGMASGTRAIPSPYDKPATPAAAQKGHVAVTVSLTNAPPGTSISATSSGIAQAPKTSVGYGYHQAQH